MQLTLPIPPSVNHIWKRHGKATYLSATYKRWLKELQVCVLVDGVQPVIGGPLSVDITIIPGKGWRSNRDLDNVFKPTLDGLCKMGLIIDDNCSVIKQISIGMGAGDGADARMQVSVKRLEG
jgi:crossover junction endodeoxyribonuclease RusA